MSMRPSSRASSISLVNRPLPPMSDSGWFRILSPVVLMMMISRAPSSLSSGKVACVVGAGAVRSVSGLKDRWSRCRQMEHVRAEMCLWWPLVAEQCVCSFHLEQVTGQVCLCEGEGGSSCADLQCLSGHSGGSNGGRAAGAWHDHACAVLHLMPADAAAAGPAQLQIGDSAQRE